MSHSAQEAEQAEKEITLHGISGAPGICIGKAYLVDREGVDVIKKYYIPPAKLQNEKNRFKTAVQSAMEELQGIIDGIPEEIRQHAGILEAQMELYKDQMLYGRTLEMIEEKQINAEWALKIVSASIKRMFEEISDPYLKERATDVNHVSERIICNLVGADNVNIAAIDKRVILVAQDLSPAETSQIQLEKIKGFVTDRGGKTSHTSIIARTLEIPAVLGLENATRKIKNDDIIIVDGKNGVVIVNPSDQTLVQYEERSLRFEEYQAAIARSSHLPAVTADGISLKLMGNIEMPEEIVSVIDYGGDGVGLFRTEFLYMTRRTFPSEDELFEQYKEVAELVAPRPVTIRTLDINGDKIVSYNHNLDEVNPALGLRAIRFCLQRPDIFMTQIRAILRAAVHGNVRIMFPMISSYEEIAEARDYLQKAAASLKHDGIEYNDAIEIGIMIEVPSAVIIADILAQQVDFFDIGTNDLVQYALAIDRGNRQVAYLYHALHPAVIRMLKHVVEVGRQYDIRISMCGEMASDPINLPVILALGLTDLSMNPQSIPAVKNAIRMLNGNDLHDFMDDVLRLNMTREVVAMVHERFGAILPVSSF
jgi:phosphotransferase system enzyme I (PtsI)